MHSRGEMARSKWDAVAAVAAVAQFYRQKLSRGLHRHPCVASKTKRGLSILRGISHPPRSGIRQHFIIRVTVASEQTRADNATPWRKCASRAGERDAQSTGVRCASKEDRNSRYFRWLRRAVPFYFDPSARSPAVVSVKSTPSSSTSSSSISASAEQKLVLSLIRVVSFAHRTLLKWEGCARRVDLIWLRRN